MSNIKKLNEYNIKDATAREDIASLDTRVENLETDVTGEDGLSNRVTTLENSLPDLTNVVNFDENDLTGDTSVIDTFYNGTIAWSNNSKWFKFFMYLKITTTPSESNKTLTLPLPQGFVVNNEYAIRNTLHVYNEDGTLEGLQGLRVNTSGITITIPLDLDGTFIYNVEPYLYYNAVIEEPEI